MHYNQRFIRVFISSTFSDMMPEREYLMKIIFPELRKRCKAKLIEITEVDLRWGISEEDSKEGKVIEICLNEIDKSRPYFIGILGNRYGWIPGTEEYHRHKKIIENFPWIKNDIDEGLSITEMEIQYGVLRNANMNEQAFFYFKNFDDNIKEEESSQKKLELLKSKIRDQSQFPTKPYNSIEELGKFILEDLWTQIQKDFPEEEIPDNHEREKLNHLGFMNNHINFFYDYNKIVELSYSTLKDKNQLFIYGEKGQGKSAIASNFIKNVPDGNDVVFYLCGATAESTILENMARFIAEEIKRRYSTKIQIPQKIENPHDLINAFFLSVPHNKQLYIVVDGTEQLLTDQYNSRLQWIPDEIPQNIKLLITTSSKEHVEIIQTLNVPLIQLETIVPDAIKNITENYFDFYSKKLPSALVDNIQYYPLAGKPIVLFTLLNELRIFGVHEELDKHLDFYTNNTSTEDFFAAYLNRLESDFSAKEFNLKGVLTSLYFSNNGLTENEIAEINTIKKLHWSQLLNVIDYHLINKNGVLQFNNPYITKAIQKKYILNRNQEIELLKPIVNYFYIKYENVDISNEGELDRLISELPELLLKSEHYEQLKNIITNINIIVQLFKKKNENIPQYFSAVKEQFAIHEIYEESLNNFIKKNTDTYTQIQASYIIGNLLLFNSSPEQAIPFFNQGLQLFLKNGEKNFYVIETLKELSTLYSQLGYFDASAYILENLLPYLHDENLADNVSLLAQLYMETGNFQVAEILYMDAIMFTLNRYGNRNLRLALEYNNLARLYDIQKDLALAEENYILASKIAYNAVGPEHSIYQTIQSNIGILYLNNQKLDAAEEVFNRVLNIRLQLYGENHRKTLKTLNSLGVCNSLKGNYEKAIQILNDTYQKQFDLLGEAHTDSLLTLSNIADILKKNNQYQEAENILRNIVNTRIKHYGAMHEQTIYSSMALADVLVSSDKMDEAKQLYETIINTCSEFYGEESKLTFYAINKYNDIFQPETQTQSTEIDQQLEKMLNEAFHFLDKKELNEAEKILLNIVKIVKDQLNGVHPAIFTAYDNLSGIYHRTMNYQLAADYANKLVEIAQQTYGEAEEPTLEYKIIRAFNLHKAAFHKEAYEILVDVGKYHEKCLNFPKEFIANFYKHMLDYYKEFIDVVDKYNADKEGYQILYNEVENTNKIAENYYFNSNYESAIKAYDNAIQKAYELNNNYGVALEKPFHYKAILLQQINKEEEAFNVLQEGLRFVTKWHSDLDVKAFYFYKLIGDYYYSKNDIEKAMENLSIADRINRNCEDFPNQETISINYSFIQMHRDYNMLEEALSLVQETIPLAKKFYGKKEDATKYYEDLEKELKKEIKNSKK